MCILKKGVSFKDLIDIKHDPLKNKGGRKVKPEIERLSIL